MFPDLNKLTDFINAHKLTIGQFYLLWCHYLDENEDPKAGKSRFAKTPVPGKRAIANIYKYSRNNEGWKVKDILDLETKKFIKITNKKFGYVPDNFELTKRAKRLIFTSLVSFDELWLAYPAFMTINGNKVPIRSEKEKCKELYLERITFVFDHEKAVIATNYAREHGMVNQSFYKYLDGDLWRSIYDDIIPDESNKIEMGYTDIAKDDLD